MKRRIIQTCQIFFTYEILDSHMHMTSLGISQVHITCMLLKSVTGKKPTFVIIFLISVQYMFKWSLSDLNLICSDTLHVTICFFLVCYFQLLIFIHFEDGLLFFKFYFLDSMAFGKVSNLCHSDTIILGTIH